VGEDATNVTKMFVFGGFTGTPRHDVLKLTPTAECNSQAFTPKECTDDANGIRCALVGKKCQRAATDLSYRQPFAEFIKNDSPKLQNACPGAVESTRLVVAYSLYLLKVDVLD
jgi:hypothetical protein